MKPRYLGPMVIVTRNKGGAYIVAELDGSVWHEKVAAFRLVPYHARKKIALPGGLEDFIDISRETLADLGDCADAPRVVDDIWFDRVNLDLDQADASDGGFNDEDPGRGSDDDSDQESDDGLAVRASSRLR